MEEAGGGTTGLPWLPQRFSADADEVVARTLCALAEHHPSATPATAGERRRLATQTIAFCGPVQVRGRLCGRRAAEALVRTEGDVDKRVSAGL
jgi:hypothetical protein